jgi:hypothetical protein
MKKENEKGRTRRCGPDSTTICTGLNSLTRNRTASALTGFEARIGLVDDVNPALTADDAVVAMATTQRFQ